MSEVPIVVTTFLFIKILTIRNLVSSFHGSNFYFYFCPAPLNLTAAQSATAAGMGNEAKIDNAIQTIMRYVHSCHSQCCRS